jgi:hypothetical protein
MKTWVKIAIPIVVIGAIAVWYWFRPERLVTNVRVNEAMPAVNSGAPRLVASGNFYGVLHPTSGTATIYQMDDGMRMLRFTNFETSNGPDVHVYMVAAQDAKDAETVKRAGFVDLGSIKGNVGDQNYTLPNDLNLAKYGAVSIWCKRFSVDFGAAALKPVAAQQAQ